MTLLLPTAFVASPAAMPVCTPCTRVYVLAAKVFYYGVLTILRRTFFVVIWHIHHPEWQAGCSIFLVAAYGCMHLKLEPYQPLRMKHAAPPPPPPSLHTVTDLSTPCTVHPRYKTECLTYGLLLNIRAPAA